MQDSYNFFLPLGAEINGKLCRNGKMHLATALDELEIQNHDDVAMNTRYRDILLLSKVIDNLEEISPVTPEILEELFETDFLYLQLLYQNINGDMEMRFSTECPVCHHKTPVDLPSLYADMSIYKEAQ